MLRPVAMDKVATVRFGDGLSQHWLGRARGRAASLQTLNH